VAARGDGHRRQDRHRTVEHVLDAAPDRRLLSHPASLHLDAPRRAMISGSRAGAFAGAWMVPGGAWFHDAPATGNSKRSFCTRNDTTGFSRAWTVVSHGERLGARARPQYGYCGALSRSGATERTSGDARSAASPAGVTSSATKGMLS